MLVSVSVYTYWVGCQNWFAFGPLWSNFDPLVAIKWLKWWFLTILWKSIIMWNNDYSIYFKHGVFTLARGVITNNSTFLPHRPNLAPLVTIHVFPFPLISPQALMCILWCIVCTKYVLGYHAFVASLQWWNKTLCPFIWKTNTCRQRQNVLGGKVFAITSCRVLRFISSAYQNSCIGTGFQLISGMVIYVAPYSGRYANSHN